VVCLRCTGASSRIPTLLKRERERERERGEERRGEDRARQDGEQRGGVGEGSVVLVSLSLTRSELRDKPLLMEEINFGLNRSPATL